MKLVIDKFVHEPPGLSIIPETDYEAAVLERYWKSAVLSTGRACSETLSANGKGYTIKFKETAPSAGEEQR